MKKQLIVLSALFVVVSSQCSYFDKMKAAAQSKLDAAKSSIRGAMETTKGAMQSIPGKLSDIKENISDKLGEWKYKAKRMVNKISPTLHKVTYINPDTGEELVQYYNPFTEEAP